MANTVDWFFGRGLSIGCGLSWAVPAAWGGYERSELIAHLKTAILREMAAPYVDTSDIRWFLRVLADHTIAPWRHRFHTTNWDYLLQREILALNFKVLPKWCAESHVYHLNGTVEDLPNNAHRSVFVLESDQKNARVATTEGNIAFNHFIWSKTFVVVGMSFECEVDRYLLSALQRIEDDLPIGESTWIVVNPSASVLAGTCSRLQVAMPRAKILGVGMTFRSWLQSKLPELQAHGVFAF
jgi:hypothetical protein